MRVSLDTNVLVYAANADAGPRYVRAVELIDRALRADCVLTLQSLGEFFNVATRKYRLPPAEAQVFVDAWRDAFPVHAADEETLVEAIEAVTRHHLSFWDAMLWATVRRAGCRLLLSEDLQDGWRQGGVTVVNPFEPANAALLDAALPPPPLRT